MKYLYYILLFLSFPYSLLAQKQQSELKDILEFETDSISHKFSKWLGTAISHEGQKGKIEHVTLKDGRNITSLTFPIIEKPVNISMATGFLLPQVGESHAMEASLRYKNKGFDIVRLIFSGFNANGEIISVDTLAANEMGEWKRADKVVNIENVSYMYLVFEMYSNAQNINRVLELDKIELKVSGHHLAEYPLADVGQKYVPKIDKIAKLSFSDQSLYQQIEQLSTKRFVALGESLHGSETLEKSAIQLMKHRILYNNCKLILLESPFEKMLSVNRFVQGDVRFDIDAIAHKLELGLYSKELLDFFSWVKEYNRTASRKVFLLGMDAQSTNFWIYTTELFDYFYRMNKDVMNDSIKKFLLLTLVDCRQAMTDVLPAIKGNVDFKKNNDSLEIRMIEHYWSDWLKVPNLEKAYEMRDSIMYSNIKYLSGLLCDSSETITLYSHLEHACYDRRHTLSSYPLMSYGAFLKNEFGNNYCTIGLFAYQGEVLHIPRMENIHKSGIKKINFVTEKLRSASDNSLENLLYSKIGYDYLFVPVSLLPDKQLYIRLGTNDRQYVNIIHPNHYMDGAIYVKESKGMQVVNGNIPISEKYQNVMRRFDKYKALVGS